MDYDYLRPDNLEEVLGLLKEHGPKATLIAGGTDVMVKIRNTKKAPEVLVSIRGLKDLRYIEKKDYHIGALTTHRMLEQSELVRTELSALYDVAGVTIYGPLNAEEQTSIISFTLDSLLPRRNEPPGNTLC